MYNDDMKKIFFALIGLGGIFLLILFTTDTNILQGRLSFTIRQESQFIQDLNKIWGKEKFNNTKAEITACFPKDEYEKIIQSSAENNKKILSVFKVNNVEVTIISPTDKSLETPEIIGGIELTKIWIKEAEKKIGEYPCERIVIETHVNYSGGSPGNVGIGGFGGVNDPWLLWHELTHSYFGTHSAQSLWLREGVSDAFPTLLLSEQKNKIEWNENYPYIPGNCGIECQFNMYTQPDLGDGEDYKKDKIYLEKNACELKEPNGIGQDYLDNSYWGRIFVFDLTLRFGSKTVTDTLKAVYAKYRYTNLTKITDKDFYDAFLFYTAKNNKTAIDKYKESEKLLKEKLCL